MTVRVGEHPPSYEDGAGSQYAKDLARTCQELSFRLLVLGWMLVAIAAALAVAGSVLGASPAVNGQDTWLAVLLRQRGLLSNTFAVLSAAIGWQLLDRSSAATRTASVATTAILMAGGPERDGRQSNDRAAYEACVKAKVAWLEGRMSHDRLESIVKSLKEIEGTPNRSE